MEPRIEVENLREVAKQLRDLGDAGAKKSLRLANKAGAEIVAAEARNRAPVRTGRLRSSIRATAGQTYASVAGGGAKAPYFGFADYGNKVHSGHGVGRKDSHPRPFFAGGRIVYPALAAKRGEVTEVYARELDRVIDDYGLDD